MLSDLEAQDFYKKSTESFKKGLKSLSSDIKTMHLYKNIFILLSVIFFIFVFLNIKNIDITFNLNTLVILICISLVFVTFETLLSNSKKKVDKATEMIKNKLIIRTCNCQYICSCKEDCVKYFKEHNINIL